MPRRMVSNTLNRFRQRHLVSFRVALCVVIIALTMPRVESREPKLATATIVVVNGAQPDERSGRNAQQTGKPVPPYFVFVPPSDSPNFSKYPEMRRWLDTHRGKPIAKRHRFKLEGGAILPATAVLRVGDSVDRYLNPESTLSLEMFSNPPMGPGPSIIRDYTFEQTEKLPIRISAVAQAATRSHALILDHKFGSASDKNGKLVISDLPTGIDIPMRVSLPAAEHNISFQCDMLDIKHNGSFVLRLDGDAEFRLVVTQAQESPKHAQTLADVLPPCVRVSGEARDSNRLLLSPAKMTIGCGPCSETCEMTVDQALELLRKHPTVRELQLWGWPVATTESEDLMRGIASVPHVSRLSLMGLQIDEPILSLVARNPHLRELALGGRCSFPGNSEDYFAWIFDAIAQSSHLERLEISRHTKIRCSEISRLKPMPRLRHFVFDGLIDKPCLEGIAHLRQLVSLELPKYDSAADGVECLSGLKYLQHLTCTWSGAQQPIAWHELSALQSLTVLADPHSFDLEAVKSLPKLQAVQVRSRELQTIGNALGMRFVPIPMTLPGKKAEVIYMQQAEVTYEQYRKFKVAAGLATTEAERTPSDQPLAPSDIDNWEVAARFIDQLNQWDTKYAYRMPTESEWEFACTGKVGGQPVVRTVCDESVNADLLFLTRQSKPNQFGLYDMLGVYGEYCFDRFNSTNDPALAQIAEGPDARVVRGMRQRTDRPHCFRFSSDHRFPVAVSGQTPHLVIGIRLVLQPKK